jgi:hypothetical protein
LVRKYFIKRGKGREKWEVRSGKLEVIGYLSNSQFTSNIKNQISDIDIRPCSLSPGSLCSKGSGKPLALALAIALAINLYHSLFLVSCSIFFPACLLQGSGPEGAPCD